MQRGMYSVLDVPAVQGWKRFGQRVERSVAKFQLVVDDLDMGEDGGRVGCSGEGDVRPKVKLEHDVLYAVLSVYLVDGDVALGPHVNCRRNEAGESVYPV